MKITIVAAGKIKERYLRMGIDEFTKRLAPFVKLNILEINEEKMPESPSFAEKQKTLHTEGERLLKQVPTGSHLIVLDVCGMPRSSEQLAEMFARIALHGQSHITFLIGGAFGLAEVVKKAAHERISFSPMTFTHQMVRLLLVEQIYRAQKINAGEPYHL